jgi:hypothetical protein
MNRDLTALFEQLTQQFSTGLGAAVIISIGLLLVGLFAIWVFLPFAIIGTKGRIDRVLLELESITTELRALNRQISILNTALANSQQRIAFELSNGTKTPSAVAFDLDKKDKPAG